MKQIYIPYWKWECYRNGMWSKVSNEDVLLKKAIEFTSNHIIYGEAMREVVFKWKNTMLNHLTNKSINRKAFLGHCAVYYKIQIPEYIVRKAWKELTEQQRILANKEAETTINNWEKWYKNESTNMLKHGKKDATKKGFQMRFPFA